MRISPRPASLTGHADRLPRTAHSVGIGPAEPGGAPGRERRAAASIGGLAETGARAPAAADHRSAVLGVAVSLVAGMAPRARHRQARHGCPVASTRVSALLAMEESAARARSATNPASRPDAHRCLRHSLLVMWRIPLQKKGLRHSSGHTRHFSHKLLQRNVLASHTNSERRKHPKSADGRVARRTAVLALGERLGECGRRSHTAAGDRRPQLV